MTDRMGVDQLEQRLNDPAKGLARVLKVEELSYADDTVDHSDETVTLNKLKDTSWQR